MSAIQVLEKDGSYQPYDENQISEMLKLGQLSPDTFYWKEGMSEWRPLKEFLAAGANAVPITGLQLSSSDAQVYHFTKNPEPTTTVLKILLVVSLPFAILFFLLGTAMLIETFLRDFKSLALEAHWVQLLGFVSAGIFILTAIFFLMWIHRATLNCRGFGAQLKFTPGMAVGIYFIPFLNLVYPCQAMQEIWKASRNPAQWQTERASILVGFWWAFWLLHAVLGQVLTIYSKTHAGSDLSNITFKLQAISVLLMILEISKIILCGLTFAMVHIISAHQKKLTEQVPAPGKAGPLFH